MVAVRKDRQPQSDPVRPLKFFKPARNAALRANPARAIIKTRKPLLPLLATVLICKLKFVIFKKVVHENDQLSHAGYEGH